LTGVANFGMSAQESALKLSEDITMKYWMLLLTAREINWQLHQLMGWHVFIMSLRGHAQLCCRDMKTKYPRFSLTHKEIRLSLLVVTKLAVCGTHIQARKYKCWTDMKMKSSHVHSIMRETLLLQVQKIIPAGFGETRQLWEKKTCDDVINNYN